MSNLHQIIYRSIATRLFSDNELIEMLNAFRMHNQKQNISGILLYNNQIFFQIIEGPTDKVTSLYESILKDPRHRLVTTIVSEAIDARSFSDWSMGFYKLYKQQLDSVEGSNDFFTSSDCLADVQLGIARELLEFYALKYNQQQKIMPSPDTK